MLIPPGVNVVVDDCLATEEDSPSVQLKEILSLMSEKGITVATIVPLSPEHLIVVGYVESDAPNAKTPPAVRPEARKR